MDFIQLITLFLAIFGAIAGGVALKSVKELAAHLGLRPTEQPKLNEPGEPDRP